MTATRPTIDADVFTSSEYAANPYPTLKLLRDHGKLSPAELWEALGVSRQGAMDLLRPLLEAGLVEKIGTKKTGRYALKQP